MIFQGPALDDRPWRVYTRRRGQQYLSNPALVRIEDPYIPEDRSDWVGYTKRPYLMVYRAATSQDLGRVLAVSGFARRPCGEWIAEVEIKRV